MTRWYLEKNKASARKRMLGYLHCPSSSDKNVTAIFMYSCSFSAKTSVIIAVDRLFGTPKHVVLFVMLTNRAMKCYHTSKQRQTRPSRPQHWIGEGYQLSLRPRLKSGPTPGWRTSANRHLPAVSALIGSTCQIFLILPRQAFVHFARRRFWPVAVCAQP